MNQELRLYTFVNFYLSSIQQGIQSAHVTHSLFVKYPTVADNSILWNWAIVDKTMIVLNGGAGIDIQKGFSLVEQLGISYKDVSLPYQCFYEDGLSNIMTAFGVVVPQCFFDAKIATDGSGSWLYEVPDAMSGGILTTYLPNTPEHQFITMLKSCGLAR